MALVAIIIKDTEDGSLDISAHAEPYIPAEVDADLSPAQTAAQVMVAALASILEAEDETEDSAAESEV